MTCLGGQVLSSDSPAGREETKKDGISGGLIIITARNPVRIAIVGSIIHS